MHFPEIPDKKFSFEQHLTNGSHSYRDKVREKIQSTPRSGRTHRQSIDLSLSSEAAFNRPQSRLRLPTDIKSNFDEHKNPPSIKERQIIRYNRSYVPSAYDTGSSNNDEVNIQEDSDFDKRSIISRPSSRESFCQDNRLKIRPKSSRRHIQNSATPPGENDKLENNLTKSVNFFNLNTSSNSDSRAEQVPIPKPRKKESILFNKQNIMTNEPDFRIKRTNQINPTRVVTPRIGYVPSSRNNSRNEDDGQENLYTPSRNSIDRTLINTQSYNNELFRPKSSRTRSMAKLNISDNSTLFSNETLKKENSLLFSRKNSIQRNT